MEKVQFFYQLCTSSYHVMSVSKNILRASTKNPPKSFFFFLVARVNKTFLFDQHLFTRKILNAVADWTYSVGIMWRAESVYESK
jgi:hypothetical protein